MKAAPVQGQSILPVLRLQHGLLIGPWVFCSKYKAIAQYIVLKNGRKKADNVLHLQKRSRKPAMSRRSFCHRDRLIELGLTMTWEEQGRGAGRPMRQSAAQAQ